MPPRIRRLDVRNHSLSPALAEVWITVVPDEPAEGMEVRGRLMGPRCPYASTVEIAYPLRPLPGPACEETALTRRVVIPEASLWDPQSPFLYEGPVELWQAGQCCDRVSLRHGLRQLALDRRGLLCNGLPLRLRGRHEAPTTDDALQELRQEGCNLLLAPTLPETADLWERAERLGMLVLGRLEENTPQDELAGLSTRASCLGWLAPAAREDLPAGGLVGLEVKEPLPSAAPPGVSLLACRPRHVEAVGTLGLPLLVMGTREEMAGVPSASAAILLGEVLLGSLE
jgi:hypothetical protein